MTMHVKRIWSQSTSITFDAEVMKAVIMKRKYQMLITAPIFSLILTSIFSWSLHFYHLCIVSYIPYSNPKGNQNFWYIDNLGKGWKENLPSFKTISKQIRASMFPIFLFFNHSWNLLSLSPFLSFPPIISTNASLENTYVALSYFKFKISSKRFSFVPLNISNYFESSNKYHKNCIKSISIYLNTQLV